MDSSVLRSAMVDAFKALGGASMGWADPLLTGVAFEEEDYQRCSNPAKYKILAARSQAWSDALREQGLAEVERVPDDFGYWARPPGPEVSGELLRVLPKRAGALPLLFALNELEGVPEAQVCVGAGDPGVQIETLPQGYFDAYDTGSPALLDEFDDAVLSVLTGRFIEVATEEFVAQDTLRGPAVHGTISGMTRERFSDLFADARAGRCPYLVVHGKRWW